MAQNFSLEVSIKLQRCLTLPLVQANKSARMMHLSKPCAGSRPPLVVFWLLEAGTKPSRYVACPYVRATNPLNIGSIKYWDLRTPNPVASITMADKVYSMDVQYPLMVVGTAERHIQIINLNSPTTIFKVRHLVVISANHYSQLS